MANLTALNEDKALNPTGLGTLKPVAGFGTTTPAAYAPGGSLSGVTPQQLAGAGAISQFKPDAFATPQEQQAQAATVVAKAEGGTPVQQIMAAKNANPTPTANQGLPQTSTGLNTGLTNLTGSSAKPVPVDPNIFGTTHNTAGPGVAGAVAGAMSPTPYVPLTNLNGSVVTPSETTGTPGTIGTQTNSTGSPTPAPTPSGSTPQDQSAAENTALSGLSSDIAAGQQYTNASGAFANGAMGRVSDTTDAATADALAKAQALEGGLTAPQMEAQKELNDQAIGGQLQSNLMQMQGIQGAQGLRGGSAAAQQMGLGYNALAQQQTAARQESLDQLAAQQTGVQNFLSDNQSNNAFNTANTQYNNQQANAEAAGRLSTPLTYAGLLQGARTGADANVIAQEGANTASQAAANAGTIAQGQLYYDENSGTGGGSGAPPAASSASGGY